ncbi:MAG: hypothetical protein V2J02_10765 [Pseudomonadales bacterium]|jgi:hypothetical protein|nr:hypothetical protein [Pseudomonadales bacterium]
MASGATGAGARRLAAVVGLLVSGGVSAATEFDLTVGYEGRASDNVARQPEPNEEEDIVHQPEARVAFTRDEAVFDFTGDYSYRRRIFQDDTFRDDFVLNGSGALTATLVPEQVTWDVSHTRTQALADARFIDNPINQQEINTTSTGVELRTRPTGRNQAALTGRIADQRSSIETNNNLRSTAGLTLTRRTAPTTTVGVSVEASDVDFEEDFVQDYQRLDARLTLSRQGARLGVELGVGYNWVEREGADVLDNPVFSGSLSYALTPSSGVTAGFERRLVDQTGFTLSGNLEPGDGVLQQGAFANVFELTSFNVGYNGEFGRTNVALRGSSQEQEFDDDFRGLETQQVGLSLSYQLTRSIGFELLADFVNQQFGAPGAGDREDDRVFSQARFTLNAGPRTRFSLGGRYDDGDSTDPAFVYTERSIVLSFFRDLI